MAQQVIFGLGGYCADCDPSHNHPLNNIIDVIELDELLEP